MGVISITIPDDLLERFDRFVESRGYYSRSEAVRDAIRSLIAEAEIARLEDGEVATTIMMTYEYGRGDVDRRVAQIRHSFDDIIIENIHRHLGRRHCLEIVIAEGGARRILSLIGRIRGIRGIQQAKSMFISI